MVNDKKIDNIGDVNKIFICLNPQEIKPKRRRAGLKSLIQRNEILTKPADAQPAILEPIETFEGYIKKVAEANFATEGENVLRVSSLYKGYVKNLAGEDCPLIAEATMVVTGGGGSGCCLIPSLQIEIFSLNGHECQTYFVALNDENDDIFTFDAALKNCRWGKVEGTSPSVSLFEEEGGAEMEIENLNMTYSPADLDKVKTKIENAMLDLDEKWKEIKNSNAYSLAWERMYGEFDETIGEEAKIRPQNY